MPYPVSCQDGWRVIWHWSVCLIVAGSPIWEPVRVRLPFLWPPYVPMQKYGRQMFLKKRLALPVRMPFPIWERNGPSVLFYPAKMTGAYYPFLLAYFILTCGLSFLETSANPYILSMGPEETATRRLNLAQSFNPMGSLLGMYVAMTFIQARLNPLDTAGRKALTDAEFAAVRDSDLSILIGPYLLIGLVIFAMFLLIRFTKMPTSHDQSHTINLVPTLKRIFSIPRYREGVVAQFFYIGVQIMCWTFIIQYGTRLFMSQGMDEKAAEVLSQKYNILAMVIFCFSRLRVVKGLK